MFSGGIEFASKRTIPIPSYLGELGKYLFTSERLLERPDRDQESTEYSIGTAAIADFAEPRRSTNPETVLSYLQAVKELTENEPAWMNDAAQSYSLAYQMVSMARRYARIPLILYSKPQYRSLLLQARSRLRCRRGSARDPRLSTMRTWMARDAAIE